MGCEYCGEFKPKQQYPEDLIIFECPECDPEYRPEQEHNGGFLYFARDSVDLFNRALDEEFIEELEKRG